MFHNRCCLAVRAKADQNCRTIDSICTWSEATNGYLMRNFRGKWHSEWLWGKHHNYQKRAGPKKIQQQTIYGLLVYWLPTQWVKKFNRHCWWGANRCRNLVLFDWKMSSFCRPAAILDPFSRPWGAARLIIIRTRTWTSTRKPEIAASALLRFFI